MDSDDEMLLPDELIEEIEDMCADNLADCLTRLESTFSRSPVACTSAPAPAAPTPAIVAATSLSISNNQYRKLAPDPIVADRHAAMVAQARRAVAPSSPQEPLREQDRLLPMANVARLMAQAIPADAKVAREAKTLMQEMVTEFICFITGEANDFSIGSSHKAICPEDCFNAMEALDLDIFLPAMRAAVRDMAGRKPSSGLASATNSPMLQGSPSSRSFSRQLLPAVPGLLQRDSSSSLEDSFSSTTSLASTMIFDASSSGAQTTADAQPWEDGWCSEATSATEYYASDRAIPMPMLGPTRESVTNDLTPGLMPGLLNADRLPPQPAAVVVAFPVTAMPTPVLSQHGLVPAQHVPYGSSTVPIPTRHDTSRLKRPMASSAEPRKRSPLMASGGLYDQRQSVALEVQRAIQSSAQALGQWKRRPGASFIPPRFS